MNANLYTVLTAGFPADLSTPALETLDGRVYTWSEIEAGTARLASWLASLGLPAEARVAAFVEKSPEALLFYLATLRAGYVYLPLNTAYRETEVAYFLGNAEPSVVVCDPRHASWVEPLAAQSGARHVVTLDEQGRGSLLAAASGQPDTFSTVSRSPDDPAAILYTSGTTGRSKGAVLSHGNLASNARVLHDFWGWRPDDVLLHFLPIFHAHGLFVGAQGALLAGARMIWLPKFDLEAVLAQLPRATVVMGVPTHYVRLLADPRFGREHVRALRLAISGSAPLSAETFERFQERTGHTILERYGMSETVMLVSNPYDPALGERLGGTVGLPLPGTDVRVVDDAGELCPPGVIGHIQVRGPNVFRGYWRMPEKTREDFTTDGWFKTGDLGRWGCDAEGRPVPANYLSIVGRGKDLIISGGFNVYPKEIESVLDALPGVAESAVIGVPHPDFGEAVVGVLIPRPGATLDPPSLLATLKTRIANFKVPKALHVLKAQYGGGFSK